MAQPLDIPMMQADLNVALMQLRHALTIKFNEADIQNAIACIEAVRRRLEWARKEQTP